MCPYPNTPLPTLQPFRPPEVAELEDWLFAWHEAPLLRVGIQPLMPCSDAEHIYSWSNYPPGLRCPSCGQKVRISERWIRAGAEWTQEFTLLHPRKG